MHSPIKQSPSVPWLALLMLLLLPACEEESTPELVERRDHAFRTVTVDGRVHAVNRGGPRLRGEPAIELDLTIGRERGPEEYIFSGVGPVATDAEGRIYVNTAPVRVYAPDGSYLTSLGGEGNGPGESSFPARFLQVWPDGTVDVQSMDGRWARWSRRRELLFDRRVKDWQAYLNTHRLLTPGGEWSYIYRSPWERSLADTSTALWIHRSPPDLSRGEVVTRLPKGRRTGTWNVMFEGVRMGTEMPFGRGLQVACRPSGGFMAAASDTPAVQVYSDRFVHELTIRWEADPLPLTEDDIRRYHKDRQSRRIGPRPPDWEQREERFLRLLLSLEYPETKPVLKGVLVGLDGRIWVERWTETTTGWGSEPDGAYDYWVFTPEGELEFTCSLPFEIEAATGEFLFEGFSDGEHTPQVRRYRWSLPGRD